MTDRLDRRTFVSQTAVGAAALGLGGAAALLGTQAPATRDVDVLRTQARRARRVAVSPDGRIVVAADRELLNFAPGESRPSRLPLDRPARSVTFDEHGALYVGLANRLMRAEAGRADLVDVAVLGPRALVASVSVEGDTIAVADASQGVVELLDVNGLAVSRIAPEAGRFDIPAEHFAIASHDGLVHVAHSGRHRVESFELDGTSVGRWGRAARTEEGFSGCCNPVGLALTSGRGFVTAERGRPCVKLFDANGRFVRELAGPDRFPENAAAREDSPAGCAGGGLDVAVGPNDTVVVLDRVTGNVHRMSVPV